VLAETGSRAESAGEAGPGLIRSLLGTVVGVEMSVATTDVPAAKAASALRLERSGPAAWMIQSRLPASVSHDTTSVAWRCGPSATSRIRAEPSTLWPKISAGVCTDRIKRPVPIARYSPKC